MTIEEIIEANKDGSIRHISSEMLREAQKVVDAEGDRVYEEIGSNGETQELVEYYDSLIAITNTIYGALWWRKQSMIL